MYWEGNIEFLGFGLGASNLLNGKRISRGKNLKKYYDYVDGKVDAEIESEVDM